MASFVAYLIGDLLTPFLGRTFFRTAKRAPAPFALLAVAGVAFGA